jgi:hypothetical protein
MSRVYLSTCGNQVKCPKIKQIVIVLFTCPLSSVSLWMVPVDCLCPGVVLGLLLGFAGLALLVGPKCFGGSARITPCGTLILVMASFAWAAGSVYSKHHPQPNSPLLGVAMQCIAGETALLIAALLSGELRGFRAHRKRFAVKGAPQKKSNHRIDECIDSHPRGSTVL